MLCLSILLCLSGCGLCRVLASSGAAGGRRGEGRRQTGGLAPRTPSSGRLAKRTAAHRRCHGRPRTCRRRCPRRRCRLHGFTQLRHRKDEIFLLTGKFVNVFPSEKATRNQSQKLCVMTEKCSQIMTEKCGTGSNILEARIKANFQKYITFTQVNIELPNFRPTTLKRAN